MNANVISAIFKRNFVSYFSNPAGYVFICVFVVAVSAAAFWPDEFFNANLANLDQLNNYLPYVLLMFIPAITMSIWAEERRQGTDELLLTIPADDFDVVLGKYLAAVAIFTVSLAFSLLCNLAVFGTWLGAPDLGLFLGNYFGYWIVGLAMIAIGMVASFLTSNLTVGFILGVLFNVPLVFLSLAPDWAAGLRRWSITEQFRDFARGVVTFAAVAWFVSLIVLMLYLSVVLIGRRHWRGGAEGRAMAGHYLLRFMALLVVVMGLTLFLSNHDRLRVDVTSEKINSLSPATAELISNLKTKYPIRIEAFISRTVPQNFVDTKHNLESTLAEIKAIGGDNIILENNQVDLFSEEATRAEQRYGIRPQQVDARARGTHTADNEIFLGVAFTCGLEKVVVPFFSKGLPVEYEVVRSIATVAQEQRKKLGILTTDAKLYGSFDMQSMQMSPNQMIVDELQKQYELVQVDPTNPITDDIDALLAVQPSSLGPQQMENFINAVKQGIPTAIFEDPFPWPQFFPDTPATSQPKSPPGGNNPFMRQPPQPKGDIRPLWQLLGVGFEENVIVWQNYNPYPKLPTLPHEFVFVDRGSGAKEPFSDDSVITKQLQQVLFVFPGNLTNKNTSKMRFKGLVSTSPDSGYINYEDLMERSFMGARFNPNYIYKEKQTGDKYFIAAQIRGPLPGDAKAAGPTGKSPFDGLGDKSMSDKDPADDGPSPEQMEALDAKDDKEEMHDHDGHDHGAHDHAIQDHDPIGKQAAKKSDKKSDGKKRPERKEVDVVLVADIDCLCSLFFQFRQRGSEEDDPIEWRMENVTFVLNMLDQLAGDEQLVSLRTRTPQYRTLEKLNEATENARKEAQTAREQAMKEFTAASDEEQKKFQQEIETLNKRKGVNQQQLLQEALTFKQKGEQRLETKRAQLKQKQDATIKDVERKLMLQVRTVQDRTKAWAALLPPIAPLLVAAFVFFNRRAKEREGVSSSRLR